MAAMGTLTSRYEKIKKHFGKRLKQARMRANYRSAEQAAHALGLEPPTYRTYERGSSLPNIEVLIRICELFKITPNDLLPDADTSRDDPSRGYSAISPAISD